MKMTLRAIVPAMVVLVMLSNSAMAQTKIATVNISKLFDGYYKTKLVQADLDQRGQQVQKDEKGMMDDLKTANTDYEQLLGEANDQALSSDERSQKSQAADAKYKDIQDEKAALEQYDHTAVANLQEQRQRMRDKIVADIQAAVTTVAKAGGYTMIFDVSAQSMANTPELVYSSSDIDLTDTVLKQLNAGAPIDTTTPDVSPLTASPPPLVSTNSP